MSANKELLKSINDLADALKSTVAEAGNSGSIDFYKESIKHSALQIFEKAQLLSANAKPAVNTKEHPEEIEHLIPEVHPEKKMTESKKVVQVPVEVAVPVVEIKIAETEPSLQPEVIEAKHEPVKHKPAADEVKANKEQENDVDTSLNAKIARFQQPVINVADKLKETPVKELVKAISISKKFEFIKELFNGDSVVYKGCLHTIESMHSYQEAAQYIEKDIAEKYNWKESENLANEFLILVKRRFL